MITPSSWSPVCSAILLFPFGACVGSFLNVVVYRLPQGESIVLPSSRCPQCNSPIRAIDNIPILSWFILRGRCRNCQGPISIRYPAVEAGTAFLWGAVGWMETTQAPLSLPLIGLFLFHLFFVSTLVAISLIDYDHRIIPDELSLGGLGVALLASALLPELHPEWIHHFPAMEGWVRGLLGAFVGAAVGGGGLWLLSILGTFAFRRQIEKAKAEDPEIDTAIGLGDVKLMAYVGAALGWKGAFAAFFLGTLLGAIIGTIDKLASGSWPPSEEGKDTDGWSALVYRWETGNSVIPYGPFLCTGALGMVFFRDPIFTFFARIFQPIVA